MIVSFMVSRGEDEWWHILGKSHSINDKKLNDDVFDFFYWFYNKCLKSGELFVRTEPIKESQKGLDGNMEYLSSVRFSAK